MKRINLNGISLTLYSKTEIESAGRNPHTTEFTLAGKCQGECIYIWGLRSKRDYVVASGQSKRGEWDSLPDDYTDTFPANKREEIRRWYVWAYDNGSVMGRPLDIRRLLPEIQHKAMKEWEQA